MLYRILRQINCGLLLFTLHHFVVLPFKTDHHHIKNYLRHKVAKHEPEKKVKEKEDKPEDKPGESDKA